ncbi:MAG TPA: hypothetical protein VLA60_12355 [Nitrospirales bacterium]|nr:hypothetical protein [Nitrospirales bacterium]
MTYPFRFLPEVEDDAVAAYIWYEQKAPGLGEEFLRTFYGDAGKLSQNPLLYPTLHLKFRRRLLRRFPYAIYFSSEEREIVVSGLFHCARDPRGIQSILQHRR